jgi:tetracycline repressor-like protein
LCLPVGSFFSGCSSRRAADRLEATHREPRHEKGPDERLTACLSRHLDFMRSRPASFKFHARGGASAEVKKIWEDSRQRFILMVLHDFYGIQAPSAHLTSAIRAWLGFFDELVLAWLQGPDSKRSGLLALSVHLFNEVLQHASLLDQETSFRAGSKAPSVKRLRALQRD